MLGKQSPLWLITLCGLLACASALEYRLSKDVIPESYEVWLTPHLPPSPQDKQFTFDGETSIKLHSVVENTTSVTVHKDFMDIYNVTLYDAEGLQVIEENLPSTYESATDKFTVTLQEPLEANVTYKLHFVFSGLIRETMAGLYYSTYNSAGVNKYVGVTQMQRINARNVFPCFDEPAMKAKFKWHISRHKEYNSMFNTRLIDSKLTSDGRYLDTFEETAPMSTYLLAFVISDYHQRTKHNVTIAVPEEYLTYIDYALEASGLAIEAYNNFTNLPYHTLGHEIFQQATAPRFPHNGMENWGLILYQDSVLVHDPHFTTWADRQFTASIIFHEVSHNWFGNSITFKWWSYFWLNEAFARYYEYFMTDWYYPELQMCDQFVIKQVHLIFDIDSTSRTQPMTTAEHLVNSPSEIANQFSGIAYAKGASILRMIEGLMGAKNFQKAIQEYLKENQLSTTEPSDLFKHWKQHWPASQQVNLTQFFADWTEQPGYPVLIVRGTPSARNSKIEITLEQQRFLLNASDGSNAQLTYTIPITFATNVKDNFGNLTPAFYFNKTAKQVTLEIEAEGFEWIVFNNQQSNYHRVFYEEAYLDAIKKALRSEAYHKIDVINRANIVDDLFNFAHAGLIDYAQVLDFMEYMERETEYLPWYAAIQGLKLLHQRMTVEQNALFGQYLAKIGDGAFNHLGFSSDKDTVLMVYNRNLIISWLCKMEHSRCNEFAQQWLHNISIGSAEPPIPDFRETLYCAAVRFADLEFYNYLNTMRSQVKSQREKDAILRAMGCTFHHYKEHYLKVINREVQQSENAGVLRSIYTQNQSNIKRLLELMAVTIDKLNDAMGGAAATANVISDMANYFTSPEEVELLQRFIDDGEIIFGNSTNILRAALKTAERNMAWSKEHLTRVDRYLSENFGPGNGSPATASVALLVLLASALWHYVL